MGAGACVVARKRGHEDGENENEDEAEEDDRPHKTATTTLPPPPSPPKKRESPKEGNRQAGTVLDRPDIEGEWWSVTPEK